MIRSERGFIITCGTIKYELPSEGDNGKIIA
jgi:hypothetical protein